ncbi:MAG: acyl-CoA dehydrogenase [Proteobacteria bacterium]|nr:acyl-CoA dehydrogenase [Pseudomonadota bacterium]
MSEQVGKDGGPALIPPHSTEASVSAEGAFDPRGSVAKLLFGGRILSSNLVPFPRISQSEAETLGMVLDLVDKFLAPKGEQHRQFDREGAQPAEYIQALRELGLFGLIIPEELGGIGLSNSGYSRVLQQTSRYDGSTSLTIGAHSSIGMKGILLFGTPAQKERYLPRLATGELIAAFCLTEPGSGSDAASIKTSARRNPDGSWSLSGEKIWITNGAFADIFTVFARTEGEEGQLSAFIVERAFQGVSNGPKEDKLGIRASATTTVSFDNVQVPPENLLGEPGKGFKLAMAILNNGRTGLGGGCVGAMKRCIELASKQALERKQFGRSIAEFALVKEKIAQMTLACFAAESIVQVVASTIDRHSEDYSVEAAISKVFASEALWMTANEALQIAGGNGYMKEFPYERVMRDSRINMIFEGTNEILRLYIGLSGMKEVGEELKEIGRSAGQIFNDPIKGFGVLGSYAAKRISRITPMGRDRFEVHESLKEAAQTLERYTSLFGGAVENTLRKYGKAIVGTQLITKRIADIAIDLYVGLCIVARVHTMITERGQGACTQEVAIANMFAKAAKRRMTQNLRRLERNEDELTLGLAGHILTLGKYPWDIF